MTASADFGRFRLRVEFGGFCSFRQQRTNSLHQHEFGELCLAISGSGRYRHGRESFPVGVGDVFLALPGVPHEISSFETGDLDLYFVRFETGTVDLVTETPEDRVIQGALSGRLKSSGNSDLAAFVAPIQLTGGPMARRGAESALLGFTLAMMETLSESVVESVTLPESRLMIQAQGIIDQFRHEGISVEELAGRLGVSSRTLRRTILRERGLGVADLINQVRMTSAAHRLLMGFSVAEVAAQFHFSEPAAFTRSFRRAIGSAPKEFQREYSIRHVGEGSRAELVA